MKKTPYVCEGCGHTMSDTDPVCEFDGSRVCVPCLEQLRNAYAESLLAEQTAQAWQSIGPSL